MPATTANDNLHTNGRRSLIFLLGAVILVAILLAGTLVSGFHLSFGNRLIKSVSNPQLNPANTLIRPIECRNANNHSEVGICMFSIDCMQNKGVPLSVCKHNYFVGTCCRLPDYNNFVGIVYDLRDTETNQLLEARKVTASTAAPSSFQPEDTTAEPPISSTDGKPERPDNSGLLIISASSSTTTSTTLSPIISSATSKQSTTASPADRYVISSTSLFPPSATTVVRPSGESARNSDGAASPLAALFAFSETSNNNHRQQIVPSELDSFQIQASQALYQQQQPNNGTDSAKKGTGYELIKDDPSLEVMTTINSAHSPLPTVSTSGQPQDSTSSLAIDELAKHPTSVVFANNHQVSLATLRPIPQQTVSQPVSSIGTVNSTPSVQQTTTTSTTLIPSAVSTQGDQEFSLATSTSDKVSNTVVIVESTTSNQSSSSQTVGQNTSPFVDLVSSSQHLASSSSSSQTTTPFTTSLSTALLPNVSSHPYSPTPEPPTPLVSSISSISKVPIRIAVGTTPEFGPSNLPSLVNQTQPSYQYLYNQHSSSGRPVAMSNGHHSQPMLASKIVTGSSSTNNHLLPAGLSSLQSAILSHIPYKLASGLTSYLQAAMKPTVGGQRPLISSNTAPALQYQQQLTANQTSTQRLSSSSSSNSTTTTTISPASFSGAASQVRFPNLNESSTLILQPVTTGQPPTMSSISTSHDVVKEALQVCGRPQVSQTNMLSNHESRRRVARIVGGNQSLFGQWPWMVSLRQWRKGAFLHKCGAALLNENWAITAAHCVENVKPADLLLRLGEFDVSNQDEPYPYVERRVKQVVSHPSFDPKTFEYDLALLRFAETVKYERNIVPVCVPSGNDTYVDRMATVIGWGRLYEDGPLPDVIQHVDVPIITNNECEKMYKNAGYVEEIPDMFICAGISKGGRDSCEGDSGGPLTMVDHDGRSYLVGIISWGIGCALPSQPGVYTRITAFSGWINQITAF